MKASGSLWFFKSTYSQFFFLRYWYFSAYGSLACKKILWISGWWFIMLISTLVLQDPKLSTISILYEWLRIWGQCGLCSCVFPPIISSKSVIVFNYIFSDALSPKSSVLISIFLTLSKNPMKQYVLFKDMPYWKLKMSISKAVFKVNTPSVITAHKIISKRLRTIKYLLSLYEKYLASYIAIITNKNSNQEKQYQ